MRVMAIREIIEDHETEASPGVTDAERTRAIARSTWTSVAVNLVLSAAQIAIGFATRSQALAADGIHTLSDLFADAIVLVATRLARKEADADHPYGHHRYETAASFALGAILVAVGGGMLWSAGQKVIAPETVPPPSVIALAAAVGTLIAKELLFRFMLAIGKRVKSTLLVANAWHARSDAASSLVVALAIAGSLAGYPILDPIAALIVGLMVLRMGARFAWDALHDLMDRGADEAETEAIRKTVEGTPGVRAVHDLRTRKMGDMLIADVHIEVDADLTVEAGHDIAVEARRRVMERHRVLNLLTHVDPWHRPDRDHPQPATGGSD